LAVIVRFFDPPATIVITESPVEARTTKRLALPAEIRTLGETPVFPPPAAVKVPVPMAPVYLIPRVVRFATPDTKSPARFNTLLLPEPRPLTTPLSDVVIVTGEAEASNDAMVFPQSSWAVSAFMPTNATPFVWGDVRLQANRPREDGLTVTVRRSAPLELIVWSVAETIAVCVRYNLSTPLLLPETAAMPFVNRIGVATPKAIAVPDELLTVGAEPLSDESAPENIRLLDPV
jgi:hypothetical protein